MKRIYILLALVGLLASCSETDETWDPYYDWEARNATWFEQIADSARTAIAQAKQQYGTNWEAHCNWRMYKSFMKSEKAQGVLTDSICARILKRGDGDFSPAYTDTVRLNFRGWIMPTEYMGDDGKLTTSQAVFTQTYYGVYDEATAAPQMMAVSGAIEGYATALQYMVAGDDWIVYIPQQQAYQSEASDAIPAYSTLQFRLSLIAVYESGSGIPDWK